MRRRPWRVEYEDAEGITRILRTYTTEQAMLDALPALKADNPGVELETANNVHFEAHKEDV